MEVEPNRNRIGAEIALFWGLWPFFKQIFWECFMMVWHYFDIYQNILWAKNSQKIANSCLLNRAWTVAGLGGSLGAFERSSVLAIVLSSPPKGDSRFTKLRFSAEDFRLALFSASCIKLDILLWGLWAALSTKNIKIKNLWCGRYCT